MKEEIVFLNLSTFIFCNIGRRGQKVFARSDDLFLEIPDLGGTNNACRFLDNSDGTYTGLFIPTVAGMYVLRIRLVPSLVVSPRPPPPFPLASCLRKHVVGSAEP